MIIINPMSRWTGFRFLVIVFATCSFWLGSWVITPAAWARTPIRLFDLSYQNCSDDIGAGAIAAGTSMPANCYLILGKAENPSGKLVYNADIFGRIYDANENPVIQNRTRLGSIDEIPPGISNFELRISVPSNQPTPLQLKQFKASGFAGTVRR